VAPYSAAVRAGSATRAAYPKRLSPSSAVDRLVPVERSEDIFSQYRDTPIAKLLEYHNLDRPFDSYSQAELLIGMCMDNRKHLHIPDNFAYILRAGGANLRPSEFKVSYAVAVGGVRAIALIGHTQCGMVNLMARKQAFVQGLVEGAGWDADAAEDHFHHFSPIFEIGSEIDFVAGEAKRLRLRYPKIQVAPMLYRVEDNRLYLIRE
jgi:carbonic anhydrase